MIPGSVIDDSRCVNDNSSVVIMTIESDATTWSITYDHHSDDSVGVITIVIFLQYRPGHFVQPSVTKKTYLVQSVMNSFFYGFDYTAKIS